MKSGRHVCISYVVKVSSSGPQLHFMCVFMLYPLRWRHNDHDSVSVHQPHGCLLNCLFRRRSKKTSKLRVTGLCVGNSPEPVNSPHKWPVTRKMFPFDDVIMSTALIQSPQPWYRLCACHTLQEWINHTFVRECFPKVFDVVTGKSVEVI